MRKILTIVSLLVLPLSAVPAAESPPLPTLEQYLRDSAVSREAVEKSFTSYHRWRFDRELGVVDGEYAGEASGLPGGIDGSANIGTLQPNGARKAMLYADRKPRINTYGDSFTHGDQVNDGETWQEYLAGHLREPVGNFGVGGYGVYQAYRRMLREESTAHAAEYLILTICCDDSTRTLFRSWFPLTRAMTPAVFSGAKPNVEMDLGTGRFVEKESLIRTQQDMYRLTEPQWLVKNLKDDLALQLRLYGDGFGSGGSKSRIRDLDRKEISKLAQRLDFAFDWSLNDRQATVPSRYAAYGAPPITPMQAQALALLNRYSQRASIFIVDKAREFAQRSGKKLLIVLVVNAGDADAVANGGPRDNQELIDHLVKEKFDYFDMDQAMIDDYKKAGSSLSFSEYRKRYFVNGFGHLNPFGNNFFAYALKGKVVEWLDPKPPTYRVRGANQLDKDYFFNATR